MDTIDVSAKYQTVDITTPKNTGAQTLVISVGDRIIRAVDVLFAPGHVGLTGVRLQYAGVTILPWNQPSNFIVGDSERLRFQLDLYAPGPLTIITHNGDSQASHRHIFTFELHEVDNPAGVMQSPTIPLLLS